MGTLAASIPLAFLAAARRRKRLRPAATREEDAGDADGLEDGLEDGDEPAYEPGAEDDELQDEGEVGCHRQYGLCRLGTTEEARPGWCRQSCRQRAAEGERRDGGWAQSRGRGRGARAALTCMPTCARMHARMQAAPSARKRLRRAALDDDEEGGTAGAGEAAADDGLDNLFGDDDE